MNRAVWIIATFMALTAGGCIFGPVRSMPTRGNSPAKPIEAKDLRPGMYCELDMRMPPTAHPEAYRCYLGTVSEVTSDGVLLNDTIEESWEDYAPWSNTAPVEVLRGTIRIPLTGVERIGITQPPTKPAAAHDSSIALPARSS